MKMRYIKLYEKLSPWAAALFIPPTRIGLKLFKPTDFEPVVNFLIANIGKDIIIKKLPVDPYYWEVYVYGEFDFEEFYQRLPSEKGRKNFKLGDPIIYMWQFNSFTPIGNFDTDSLGANHYRLRVVNGNLVKEIFNKPRKSKDY